MLIDSHCHIHDKHYDFNASEVLQRAYQNQVKHVVVIGNDPMDSRDAANFSQKHQAAYWTFGYHPNIYKGEDIKPAIQLFHELTQIGFKQSKLVAIGEIGLDYHYEHDKKLQISLLENMLQLAQDYVLPVSFHVREAFKDFWPIYDNFKLPSSVLHSFSDNQDNLDQALRRDLYIGVNGLATFANIPLAPLDRIVLETDSPYLTPRPFRGKINEPSYIKNIAEWLAESLGVSFVQLADQTTANTKELYNL